MATVAVFTQVYNERFKLKRWVDYYSRQLGSRNYYVIDHGTDDGSTDKLDAGQIIRLPRTPFNNIERAEAMSSYANFLLKFYDYVLYTDCDEIIVADPQKYQGLGDFCNKENMEYVYSIGVDIMHNLNEEAPLRGSEPVLSQRAYGHFSAAMCKPNITRIPVKWARGFHSCEHPPVFGGVFNFHLRYSDLDEGLNRLSTTRTINWANSFEGAHQRVPDSEFERLIRAWSKLPVVENDPWQHDSGLLSQYLANFTASAKRPSGAPVYDVDLSTFGSELMKIPERFVGCI